MLRVLQGLWVVCLLCGACEDDDSDIDRAPPVPPTSSTELATAQETADLPLPLPQAPVQAPAGSQEPPDPSVAPSLEPTGPERTADGGDRQPTDGSLDPPPTAELGTLFITTPGGWANVYDEAGRLLGQTPLRTELPAGMHRLKLRPFGNPPDRMLRTVVRAGRTERVSLRVSGD